MTLRLRQVSVKDGYRVGHTEILDSEEYRNLENIILKDISKLPDNIPLLPIDVVRQKLLEKGYNVGEVSGRNLFLEKTEIVEIMENGQQISKQAWKPKQNKDRNPTKSIIKFQNGEYDAIVITKAGSTGYSMHASLRYKDSRAELN
jgi:hypothetical protein